MGPKQAIRTCLRKWVTFSGRAPRSEYWWFFLFVMVTSAILTAVDTALFGGMADDPQSPAQSPLASLFQLAMFLPLLAAGWRRLHDSGRPGWYLVLPVLVSAVFVLLIMVGAVMVAGSVPHVGDAAPQGAVEQFAWAGLSVTLLIGFLQIVAFILLLWWLTRPSAPEANRFGPAPLS